MRKCVGCVKLPGRRLTYYVIGNRTLGYGVQITETCVEKAERIVCDNLTEAIDLAQELHRCSVFPSNLTEIVEDYQYSDNN
jgi:hypothetical protein